MSTPILRVRDAQGNYIPIPAIQGRDGVDGKDGKDGAAGPNLINLTTLTPLTGILMGSGGSVKTAVSGTDYATPAEVAAKVGKDDYTRTINTATTTGTAANYVLTLDPAPSALVQGMMLLVNFHVASETTVTPPTININGTGAKYLFPVGQNSGKPFSAGLHIIFYDGTHWRMMDNAFLPIIGGSIHGSIIPLSMGYNLGSSSNPWGYVYANCVRANGNDVWHNGLISTATATVQGQEGDTYQFTFTRVGRLVTVTCPDWIGMGATANNVQIGTIPSGYRPASNVYGALVDPANYATIRFLPDGKIMSNSGGTNYVGFFCGVTYFTN